jgi:hypothetical protein
VLIAAPLLAKYRFNPNVQGFVKGAYAAAIGTILGACVLLGRIAIGDWLSAAPEWIPASVLLMELRERGYCGGYTMLKLFVASLRPQQAVEPVIRFETGPGEQMQVDWAALAPCMMRGPGCAAGESGPSGGGGMSALISWCPKPTTSSAPI